MEWPRMTSLDYHSDCCDCESCVEEHGKLAAARRLDMLAANLRWGAALCRAFWLGDEQGFAGWSPGCGRPAFDNGYEK